MKRLKNKLNCINILFLSLLFVLIFNNTASAKTMKFEQTPFNNAIKAISAIYGVNISVIGDQPKVDVTLELNNDSITKDIKRIVSYCGIKNYILLFDDKKEVIKLFILGSGTLINKNATEKLVDDTFKLLTEEQIRKLAVIANDQNLDDSKSYNQILTTEQVLLLQEEAINKGSDFKEEDNKTLTTDQMLSLQEEAISKGYGFKKEDNKALTYDQVDELEEIAIDQNLIFDEETDSTPLTKEQILLLQKENKRNIDLLHKIEIKE
jgi:hypothetical protein